ncbi:putative sugar O-methyltransferase [Aliiroseovarius sp. YM-037]|uniref:putative sugar O-methyltransferase n=1 Tax=Aliiroseovarius sp. YM-037 TaxID=3341728 RepID=UPI003A807D12
MADDGQTLMEVMLSDMDSAPVEFRPTNFWEGGVAVLVDELREHGFEKFRTLNSSLGYFVPNYGDKFYRRWKKQIDGFLNRLSDRKRKSYSKAVTGLERGRTDYRLFSATTTGSALGLQDVSESDVGGGERFEFGSNSYSKSMLSYLRAMTLMERNVDTNGIKSWLEIGGGYGSLGEIVLKGRSDAFYVNVDIPPVAAVSTWYLQQVFGAENVLDYAQSRTMETLDLEELRKTYRAVILCPWQLPKVTGTVDVFANFISFQEMEPSVVANYVRLVQPLTEKHVLMRNSRYGKALATKAGEAGTFEKVTTDGVIDGFDAFEMTARDSLVHGDETPDRSFRSEVSLLTRKTPLKKSD